MKRKKPQEFKTNESSLSILTIIKVKKNTFFDPFIKIFSNDFFQPLKSGKKLRWEAYSNFHQRLLQKTWGRVNYGISRPIISWRQNAWLWSTSLKVKYDWENCFCPKKCSLVEKVEKLLRKDVAEQSWDRFLTDFSWRLQAELDRYLPWNNWIKLLYSKWLKIYGVWR